MEKGKQHLDDYLRDTLNSLPNAPVAGFEKLEQRMAAKHHRGVLLLFLIPFLASGIYWLSTLNEADLVVQPPMPDTIAQPANSNQIAEPLRPAKEDLAVEVERPKPQAATAIQPSVVGITSAVAVSNATPSAAENIGVVEEVVLTEERSIAAESQETQDASESGVADETTQVAPNETEAVAQDEPIAPVEYVVPAEEQTESEEQDYLAVMATQSTPETVTINSAENAKVTLAASPISANTSRWSVHANFYPNYTFRELHVKSEYQSVVDERYTAIVNESERGGFAFNAGIAVRYNLGNDLFISSGLGYIEMKVTGNYDYSIYECVAITKTQGILVGKTSSDTYQKETKVNKGIIQAYRYLQVPLHLSYQPWATDKLRLIIEGGVSYVRFISADGTTIDPITMVPHELSDLEFNQNLGTFDFKIGFAYFVNQQVSLGLEPSLMYFSNSIYAESNPLYVVPWSVGVNFNVALRLY
jgi:hypothetical protein